MVLARDRESVLNTRLLLLSGCALVGIEVIARDLPFISLSPEMLSLRLLLEASTKEKSEKMICSEFLSVLETGDSSNFSIQCELNSIGSLPSPFRRSSSK